MTKEEHRALVKALMEEMAMVGVLRTTGEFRDGQPLYVPTELDGELRRLYPNEDDYERAYQELVRQHRNGGG